MISNKKLNFIDLFCGAGGLSLPFKLRSHKLILALDNDKTCISTLKHNFKYDKTKFINENIKNFLNKKNYFRNINLDLLMGGPPCQGFSTANRQNIINDPRNELYKYFIKFAQYSKPKFILIENVIGIRLKADDIIAKLNEIDYIADYRVLQASDFGIPQNRKRVFFFAIKKSEKKILLENFFQTLEEYKMNTKKYFLKDALYGLRALKPKKFKNDRKNEYFESGFNIEEYNSKKTNSYLNLINSNKKIRYTYNHMARFNNKRDIEIFSKLPQGGDSTHSSIKSIMPYKSRGKIFKDKYFKLINNKISKTITSHMKFDCNMYIHPTQARGLTPREAARIQSFPDDYFFEGTKAQCYSQIGNAVPPLLSRYICLALEKINDKNF